MPEAIKLEFPKNNVLNDQYRAQLMIEEIAYRTLFFHFSKIEDPRKENGKRHQLVHIFILTIIGFLRGHTDFENMVDDLRYDEQELTEKLGLKHGIPSHDTFSRVFRLIDAKAFMHAFIDWTYSYIKLVNEHVAIDGKAVRAAAEKVEGKSAPYIVNSFVCNQELVLGQLLIDRKTNEITGIPQLIELLDLKGCTITIDAIGCQKKICDLLHEKKAHFVLPVKENQRLMHEAIEQFVRDAYEEWLREEEQIKLHESKGYRTRGDKLHLPYHDKMDVYHEIDPKAEHGRAPGDRLYIVVNDLSMIDRKEWKHVKAVGYTIRKRTEIKRENGIDVSETSEEENTWILSRKMTAKETQGTPRSKCSFNFACNTCKGETGRDCRIHRCLPSSEIEGAVMSIIEHIISAIAAKKSGRISAVPVSASSKGSIARMSARKTSSITPAIGKNSAPSPQFSIYTGLATKRFSSFCKRARSTLFCAVRVRL